MSWATKKVFLQTNSTDGKRRPILPRGDSSPPDINNPKWGTPNPKNGSWNFVFCILSNVEKFAEFNGEIIIFLIRAKIGEYREKSVHGRLQDKRKLLLPENCFCEMAVSNWRSSSTQPSSFLIWIYAFMISCNTAQLLSSIALVVLVFLFFYNFFAVLLVISSVGFYTFLITFN